jgi:hypothetical protein
MAEFKLFEEEQHRQGQRAVDHDPRTRVVSAALYNSVVDKYNALLKEYNEAKWMYEDLCK